MYRPFVYLIEIRDHLSQTTLARWQSRWVEEAITWDGQQWRYLAGLAASGVVSGQTIGAQASIALPLTHETLALATQIASPPGIAVIRKYDLVEATDTSQMLEVGNCIGQVTQITKTDTGLTFALGSSISPIGASFVPRTVTTELIGNGMII
jgi:hypothetical protein